MLQVSARQTVLLAYLRLVTQTVAFRCVMVSSFILELPYKFLECVKRLTVCVMPLQGYWWAGRGDAILTEPTPSHTNCLKTRRQRSCSPTTTPAWFANQTKCGASVAPALF